MLLNEEQQLVRDTMRAFARERLAPNAARWDRESHFPRAELAELGALGALGMVVPEEWDGAGADYVSLAVTMEEIAAGDGATSTILSVQNSVVCGPLNAFGTDAQKERYLKPLARGEWLGCFCLTEPHVGSDAGAIATRADRRGDRFVLNGVKQFITSGKNADVAIVFAVTDKAAGKKGISAFVVDTATPGYRVARVEEKLGLHGSPTCVVQFDHAEAFPLGPRGGGFRAMLDLMNLARLGVAAQAVGIAETAYQAAAAHAATRVQFGQALIHHPLMTAMLAAMRIDVSAARAMPTDWAAMPMRPASRLERAIL